MLRFLLVEAAQVTLQTAKVAMARRLAIRLYWMMRQVWDYQQWSNFGSHAGQPGHRDGVQSNIE